MFKMRESYSLSGIWIRARHLCNTENSGPTIGKQGKWVGIFFKSFTKIGKLSSAD
jgi:hypothetical protein